MFHVKHCELDDDWRAGGFGLYLHWPFCESKCPYCDFNSHVATQVDEGRWRAAYLREIDRAADETSGRVLRSVFLGGGTPSLMSPELVAAILERIRSAWRLENDFEVTLEANPGSVEAGRFAGYRDAGVNRVSIGVQSLRDDALRQLGRKHDAREARKAVDLAQSLFPRVSFDLIYARENQSAGDWEAELLEALSLGTSHLSLYQLTIEPGTPFAARLARGGLRGLPGEDRGAELYQLTQKICDAAGRPAYEVSNHSRPDDRSKHNSIYWRAGDYVGIGPGAHGRLTIAGKRLATEAIRAPSAWLAGTDGDTAELPRVTLSRHDQAVEYLMMGLRLRDGISLSRLGRLSGYPTFPDAFKDLVGWGMVEISGDSLVATESGRLVLNSVIAQAVSALERDLPST